MVISHLVAHAVSQIQWWSLSALPTLFPQLPHLPCTNLQNRLDPLPLNAFHIINLFQWPAVLKSHQTMCKQKLPVRWSISKPSQMVLWSDTAPIPFLQTPCHAYSPPHVEPVDELPHPFGTFLHGEFCLFQAVWGFAFSMSQV